MQSGRLVGRREVSEAIRHTGRQADRETGTQGDSHTYIHTLNNHIYIHAYIRKTLIHIHTHNHTCIQTDRHT